MSVITASKSYDDVHRAVTERGDLEIVVLGCDKCAKTSRTGGAASIELPRRLKERSRVTAALNHLEETQKPA